MPTNTYVALATQTLASPAASVTFSSIPQGYTDLVVVTQYPFVSTGVRYATYQVGNGTVDTGTNYSNTYLDTYAGSPNSGRSANLTFGLFSYSSSAGLSTSQTQFGMMHFMNYSSTTTFKTTISRNMSAGDMTSLYGNLWRSTAAINIITITAGGANFAAGSTFSIYGISNAGDSSPKALGGDVYSDANYWYHAFTMSGNFTPTQAVTADILVVAGGAGGGQSAGASGGGGAGGVLGFASQSLTSGVNYQVLVGGGGAKAVADGVQGGSGSNSTFAALTASVGGGGGAGYTTALTGGSGGGGGYYLNTNNGVGSPGAAGTSGQGNAGGAGWASSGNHAGGAGGGAGAVGGSASVGVPGPGGAGTSSVTNFSSLGAALTATGLGVSGLIAGGGGGGAYNAVAAGGSGGGGVGARSTGTNSSAGNGVANTGSGGGGGASNDTVGAAGSGGSGVVIVRYAK
jgi:hypothetical protein